MSSPDSIKAGAPTLAECNELFALFNAGQHLALENRTRILIARFPESGFAWKVLGAALQAQGKNAVPAMQKAVMLLPTDAEAHSNLGVAMKELGQLDDAVASLRRALALKPDYAEAHSNLGNALTFLGQLDDAVASYRRALALKPDYAEAHSYLGAALTFLGQFDDAVTSYRRALALKPDYAEAHSNLGNVLTFLGQLDDAVASYRRALALKPDYADAHNNLGTALKDLGQLDDAVASYRRALALKPDYTVAHSNLLLALHYKSDQPTANLLNEAQRFGHLVTRHARPYTDWPNNPEPGRWLRVGLVSGDLRNHPVGYFLEGMLTALASKAADSLELIAYPSYFQTDELTQRIKSCCHGWHSAVGLADENLARQIRDDGIDILIDLSGHTAHNRLAMFAWKPAPVQVSWLGYFATTGVAEIDYLLADPYTLPPSEEGHFTETIWRLPETRLCFTAPDLDIPVGPLPALTNGYITFGCLNTLAKMNDAVVTLWSQILTAMPTSRLLLKDLQFADVSMREYTLSRFAVHGIGAARIILEGRTPRADYLAAYQRVDLALDPFPYPGGTTSVDALWMGVPVVTLAGQPFLSRQGVGILMNAGLPDWIATDADGYVAKVIAHASNIPRLAALRSGLRQQVLASPIFDTLRFARHFESALRSMWQTWCIRQLPSTK